MTYTDSSYGSTWDSGVILDRDTVVQMAEFQEVVNKLEKELLSPAVYTEVCVSRIQDLVPSVKLTDSHGTNQEHELDQLISSSSGITHNLPGVVTSSSGVSHNSPLMNRNAVSYSSGSDMVILSGHHQHAKSL